MPDTTLRAGNWDEMLADFKRVMADMKDGALTATMEDWKDFQQIKFLAGLVDLNDEIPVDPDWEEIKRMIAEIDAVMVKPTWDGKTYTIRYLQVHQTEVEAEGMDQAVEQFFTAQSNEDKLTIKDGICFKQHGSPQDKDARSFTPVSVPEGDPEALERVLARAKRSGSSKQTILDIGRVARR